MTRRLAPWVPVTLAGAALVGGLAGCGAPEEPDFNIHAEEYISLSGERYFCLVLSMAGMWCEHDYPTIDLELDP